MALTVEQKELASADVGGLIFGSRGGRKYVWLDSLLGATSPSLLLVIGSSSKPWQTLLSARAETSDQPLFHDKGESITCLAGLCISWLAKAAVNMPLGCWDTGEALVPGHSV